MGEAGAGTPSPNSVMQGDIVQSSSRGDMRYGWICCITPESDEGHVYWQPIRELPSVDSRESLQTLRCADRALIAGDIVRRSDITSGEVTDHGGRDRDAMGMVVGSEVMLDLLEVDGKSFNTRRAVPAASLRHLVPIRLATWVVHRADGWLGRVQSWDEDLVVQFSSIAGGSEYCRCRIRAANQKQGIAIVESFYRDFFPGLSVSVSQQELKSEASEFEWLSGDVSQVAFPPGSTDASSGSTTPRRVEAFIEQVCVGSARVEWLAQVPLCQGWSTERPPRSDGCQEDRLLFLLGEAECSSRWALGDRVMVDGRLVEVTKVETFVDVRWQDDALSVRVPARELQLCNPDAFSFFPSELVCSRNVDECMGGMAPTPFRGASPAPSPQPSQQPPPPPQDPAAAAAAARPGTGANAQAPQGSSAPPGFANAAAERTKRDEQCPRLGFVVRADPASRMVRVRWLDESGVSQEEEWSAFDLQIDPEFGYRLGDAVIRCRDWEGTAADNDGEGVGPRVGQVVALESGFVRVRWLDGAVKLHGPRDLYRLGDEDEGSMAESQDAAVDPLPEADAANALAAEVVPDVEGQADGQTQDGAADADAVAGTAGGPPSEAQAMSAPDQAADAGVDKDVPMDAGAVDAEGNPADPRPLPPCPAASKASGGAGLGVLGAGGGGSCGSRATCNGSTPSAEAAGGASNAAAKDVDMADASAEGGEISFEDMAWEALPSDHHFMNCAQPSGAPSGRQFVRRVQREWSILQRGLPRGVWVHVYPDRMELLRACLVGPEGTPYSDALFFFDVHLPPTYPQIPPQVRFWSFGENLNPNLYENGKVCLSLLGTWSGKDSETWSPERSNLLQVLVSILGLVLNTEPYYNEPGFERERDTPQGGLRSQRYNESVALSNYHLMLRVLRTPPCDFDGAVKRHFAERRTAILDRARRILNGGDDALCSEGFRKSLAALLPRLEEALPQVF